MPRKTKEKSPKEKSPNLKDSEPESEDPVMDKAAINRLLQNALDEANARAEQKLEERLTALREEINQKHQEEMIELQDQFAQSRGANPTTKETQMMPHSAGSNDRCC
jgi:hypothetical protein